MADLKKLAEEIVGLTLLEAAELKNILKDDYGIDDLKSDDDTDDEDNPRKKPESHIMENGIESPSLAKELGMSRLGPKANRC